MFAKDSNCKMMQRRYFLKETILGVTGLVLLHGCVHTDEEEYYICKKIKVSKGQQQLLQALVAAIIPTTDTKGAGDLDLHYFVLKMVDDCYVKEDQDTFIKGLALFEDTVQSAKERLFLKISDAEKIKFVKDLVEGKDLSKELAYFLYTTKSLTIKGYRQSEYVMTNLILYKMTPGSFRGCVGV